MARRFPVTTASKGGVEAGGLYRAIAPANAGDRFNAAGSENGPYEMATPTLFQRTRYTVGIVERRFYDIVNLTTGNNGFEQLFVHGPTGTDGFRISKNDFSTAGQIKYWEAQVGSTTVRSNTAIDVSNTYTITGPAEVGLHMHVIVVDDDAYPGDLWFHNGRYQSIGEESTAQLSTWDDTGGSVGSAAVLGGGPASQATRGHIIGAFYHLDAMTYEELMILFMNIKRFKDIPDTDPTGLGTVPDHIWSVKRAMTIGTNGLASWVSDGATGGETFTRTDSTLKVIEFDEQFAEAR